MEKCVHSVMASGSVTNSKMNVSFPFNLTSSVLTLCNVVVGEQGNKVLS
jgi:hypothetical protein